MKLLFVTQKMDKNDSVLGAYHGWVSALAEKAERITVICLFEGQHTLPEHVRVYSLGKELGAVSSSVYAFRFLSLVWKLRNEYDAVFVHMNQEYVLISGWLWKLLGKRIYLWRNHYAGSLLTDIAAAFCTSVFCTSKHSYTAKYKKTVFMPVGVDIERFSPGISGRVAHSILFFARIAPSKRPDMFVEALNILKEKGIAFTASIVGSPLPEHEAFYEKLTHRVQELGLTSLVSFRPGVPHAEASTVFAAHEIFVNTSPSGMFDKTIFEAAASGCLVLSSSEDLRGATSNATFFSNAEELAARLETLLSTPPRAREAMQIELQELAQKNALPQLISKLSEALTK